VTEKSNIIIKLIATLIVALLLYIGSGINGSANTTIEKIYSQIAGERNPDTNIVIIHITKADLDRIGPWPIKRSYYALLIKHLTEQEVKKIGLEVFLSSRLITQSIYDKLLKNEIQKSGRVVLSSLAGSIKEVNRNYFIDSLSFPSPKLLNPAFETGHINFLQKNGIEIPLKLNYANEGEKAFSFSLAGKEIGKGEILVNIRSSWKKFTNYSLAQYFNLVQSGNPELDRLKDKIVIIGISDARIAQDFTTAFDDNLPGVALHAFTIDNILNARWINDDYYSMSSILFLAFILGFIIVQSKFKARPTFVYTFAFGISITITFILFTIYNYRLANSYLFIPLFIILIIDVTVYMLGRKNLLQGVLNEKEVLKNLLEGKQSELTKLQNEVKDADGSTTKLLEKIRDLESYVEKLKENDEDKIAAEEEITNDAKIFHGIIFRSKVMGQITDIIKKTAPEEATVLITGESGTGKELVARALHNLSKRKDNNFITVNCAALTESLLESELFGHVKGSFTGAITDKKGKFEAADKGTIFLDEIGETSENFQVKFLRVLQSGEIEKVGSSDTLKVDVRIIAATNKDPETEIKNKNFREDLYYRLNVIRINLPPLRERKEDIEVMTSHFLLKEESKYKLSKAVSKTLMEYDWKGNVRELESVIKRGIIFARVEGRELLQLSDLPKEIVKGSKFDFVDLVMESLRNKKFSHSSITETAKELGNVNRTMVSENFRGFVFKTLVENDFNLSVSINSIVGSEDEESIERVAAKVKTFIGNIDDDLSNIDSDEFKFIKSKFSAKYKNLPAKFHYFLDEIIKWKLKRK